MNDRIYLDNAATTALSPAVLNAMMPYLTEVYGNPSSIHATGRTAHKAIDAARKQVAAAIGATHQEIYFTAGGSESDNWAIKGAAFARQAQGNHIITSCIEHHAVLHTCQWLEQHGFEVTYLPVNADGFVDPADVEKAITDHTILISIMMANNEIGTIQPISEISAIAHAHGILMHTDAVQAVGAIPVDVQALGCDMLSLSGHKFHGPKGSGALYIRKGVRLDSVIHGGAQERGLRAGTENVPAIVGLGKAIELAAADLDAKAEHIARMRDRLMDGLLDAIPGLRINGSRTHRLPNNCNIAASDVEGEALLLRLDLAGIAGSSGSACTSGSVDPSHVLLAIGLSQELAHGSLRLTLSDLTTDEEIDEVLRVLPEIVQSLRAMNPGYRG